MPAAAELDRLAYNVGVMRLPPMGRADTAQQARFRAGQVALSSSAGAD
jgi:hypothetical protein